jgi:hypothetical protein
VEGKTVSNDRKRQKKLERKNAKRKEKKHVIAREQSTGMAGRIAATTRFPVEDALISVSFYDQGIGQVLLSRSLPEGSIAIASFLVDRYCLGVKDAFGHIITRSEYEDKFLNGKLDFRRMTPPDIRKLVDSAVEYARSLGFAPHSDYHKAYPIFGDINAAESTEEFEFGKDGKPFYVAGPHDGAARIGQILGTLRERFGEGGFHYMVPMMGDDSMLIGDEDEDGERRWTDPID